MSNFWVQQAPGCWLFTTVVTATLPCACSTNAQQAVLDISDSALVKECQKILQQGNASAQPNAQAVDTADTAAVIADTDSGSTSATAGSIDGAASPKLAEVSAQSDAALVDIMDMETQVLDVLTRVKATPAAAAAHKQHDRPSCSARPAATIAMQPQHRSLHYQSLLANQVHQQHPEHERAGALPDSIGQPRLKMQDQQRQSCISAAEASHAHQPAACTVHATHPEAAAKAAADTTSGMNDLLEAMLAGDL